jgi:predicted phosphodiesterase
LAVGLGDYIEAISFHDKRFDPSELSEPITPELLQNPFYEQALRFVKLFDRTRGKWLCFVAGNHEERATHYMNFDPLPIIAERLGAPYHGGSDCGGWMRIRMFDEKGGKQRNAVDMFLSHGSGGGSLRGGDALNMQRLAMRKQADIVAVGHGHKPGAFPETSEWIDAGGFEQCATRWAIECFPLVGKHGYIARKGCNSSAIGYVVAEITMNTDRPADIRVTQVTL